MTFYNIIRKIAKNKIVQQKNCKKDQQKIQFNQLVKLANTFLGYMSNSVILKYNGKYFSYICDSNSFYYLGNKRILHKYIFQIDE